MGFGGCVVCLYIPILLEITLLDSVVMEHKDFFYFASL